MSSLSVSQRGVGAIVGSLIADAAAMPTHWIYDDDRMKEVLEEYSQQPEFIPKSQCPFYNIPTGRNSCNGDQIYVLLQSLVECKGFNKEDYTKRILEFFGRDSEYEIDLGHPITKADFPLPGPWRPKSIKALMGDVEKMERGHGDVFGKVAPLVALYAGSPKLAESVKEMTCVLQDDDLSVNCAVAAAAVLEQYVLHGPDPESINKVLAKLEGEVVDFIKASLAAVDKDHSKVVAENGKACPLPGSFKNAVHCIAGSDGDFIASVRKTIVAGGDSVSRGSFIGACLGAQLGLTGLPQDWISKTDRGSEVISLSERLVALRE